MPQEPITSKQKLIICTIVNVGYVVTDETFNNIISECRKLVQKEYKTRHDWMGRVIHWELCKFAHTDKWYMNNPEPFWENEIHKILLEFEIQTDVSIPLRTLDLIAISNKRRICHLVDFAILADYRVKMKKCKKINKCLDLAREIKKSYNIKVAVISILINDFGTISKGLEKKLGELEIRGKIKTIQLRVLSRLAKIL